MLYQRKKDKIRAFRLPSQPDDLINNDLVLMLNEKYIGEKWVSMVDGTIKIKTPMGERLATWGDWIINQGNDLFVMSNQAFQDNFDICISFDRAIPDTDKSVYRSRDFINQ